MQDETKKRVNVYVDLEQYELIQKEAKKLGLSTSAFFNVAAAQYIQQSSVTQMVDFFKKFEQPPQG